MIPMQLALVQLFFCSSSFIFSYYSSASSYSYFTSEFYPVILFLWKNQWIAKTRTFNFFLLKSIYLNNNYTFSDNRNKNIFQAKVAKAIFKFLIHTKDPE